MFLRFDSSDWLDRSTVSETRLRLLYIHAAILAYRWWHGNPPATLDALKLGDMAIDSFSGQPFVYKPTGYTYKLYSVGIKRQDGGGKPGTGSWSQGGDLFVTPDGSR
jgi:hypothetical protein